MRKMKQFIIGVLIIGTTVTVSAQTAEKSISVLTGINVFVDGVKFDPVDANGNPIEIFTYQGITYVPSESLSRKWGKEVHWDSATQSLYLGPISVSTPPHNVFPTQSQNITTTPPQNVVENPTQSQHSIHTFTGETSDTRLDVLSMNYWISSGYSSPVLYMLCEVKNTGTTPLYLGSQTFDIETNDGMLLGVEKLVSADPRFLLPGEVSFVHEETLMRGLSLDTSLVIKPHFSIQKSGAPIEGRDRFPTSDVRIENDSYFGFKVFGRVSNTSSEEQSIRIVSMLWDKQGKPLYLLQGMSTTVAAGSIVGFELRNNSLPEHVTEDNIGRMEVYAYQQWKFTPISD